MRFIRKFLGVFFVLALFVVTPTFGDAIEDAGFVPEFSVPDDVQSDGAFQYSIPFDIPDFRGLVPNIGLRYNSSSRGRGSASVWIGSGWQLTGFLSIERVSIGGGTPTYDDTRDLYRIDGMELLACSDANAINPLPATRDYPDRYRTNFESASCTAGGNFVAMREDYRRVQMVEETYDGHPVTVFLVTTTNGTVYRYESLGQLSNETMQSTHAQYNDLFERQFLLTSVTDAQVNANTVVIGYNFASRADARAHSPDTVSYSGYQVAFHYENLSDPLATYATGTTGILGRQDRRLRSITVTDNGTPVRAYALEYSLSAETSTSLLTRVRQYDQNYVLSGSLITGGGQLPSPIRAIQYAQEAVGFTEQTYAGTNFHQYLSVYDFNQDGRSDLMFRGANSGYGTPGSFPCVPPYLVLDCSLTAQYYELSTGRALSTGTPPAVLAELGTENHQFDYEDNNPLYSTGRYLDGILGYHVGDNQIYAMRREEQIFGNGPVNSYSLFGLDPDAGPFGGSSFSSLIPGYGDGFVYGNFDDDSEPEVVLTSNYYLHVGMFDIQSTIPDFNWYPRTGINAIYWSHNANVDIDGDGSLELVVGIPAAGDVNLGGIFLSPGSGNAPSLSINFSALDFRGTGFVSRLIADFPGYTGSDYGIVRDTAWGDINGDGTDDLVILRGGTVSNQEIQVSFSNGDEMMPWVNWGTETTMPELGFPPNSGEGSLNLRLQIGSISLRDVNGDGLADLILLRDPLSDVSEYFETENNQGETSPYYPGAAVREALRMDSRVYLSTGHTFVPPSSGLAISLTGVDGWGDLDGDGVPDAALEGDPGRIAYGSGGVPNLMTSFIGGLGAATRIEYESSAADGNNTNRVPGVYQLVAAIERDDGRGQTRRITYSYVNSQYDYENRRPLGYRTITANLPAADGESVGPRIVTNYLNDHFGERGLVRAQTYIQDGQTWRKTVTNWTVRDPALRPYRAERSSHRVANLQGAVLVETRQTFVETLYGVPWLVRNWGFTDNAADLDPSDNSIVITSFRQNLTDYLVGLPESRLSVEGFTPNWGTQVGWLEREFYTYEGNTTFNQIPFSPNVIEVHRWTGDISSSFTRQLWRSLTYDGYGNVVTTSDALSNTTTFSYDTARHLFRTAETNALGHSATTSWDTGCQAPSQITGANGLISTFTYDTHCRETRRDLPSGQYQLTNYVSWGDPTAQYLRQQTRSANDNANSDLFEERSYTDGLGQVWRSTASGATEAEADMIVVDQTYDLRGHMIWQSIPLSWSDAVTYAGSVPQTERTGFTYDPLGRALSAEAADGALTGTSYDSTVLSGVTHPVIIITDAHCLDLDPVTLCGEVRSVSDASGNIIQAEMTDINGTDIGASGAARITSYSYDVLNRLVGVTDPIGAVWAYSYDSYDSYGNRISADDPDLGYWVMSYDEAGNLDLQTDALGQTIDFDYDALNRVSSKTVTGTSGAVTTTWTYDQTTPGEYNIGLLTTLTNPDHTITYGYNDAGLPTRTDHTFLGRTYSLTNTYHLSGALLQQYLPTTPGLTTTASVGTYSYDTAGRVTSFGPYVTGVTYGIWGTPLTTSYGNGVTDIRTADPQRGWLTETRVFDPFNTSLNRRAYTRTATGRVSHVQTNRSAGQMDYTYDYAGRLLTAINTGGVSAQDQSFTYDAAGNMRSNSHIGSYTYGAPTANHPHAPTLIDGDPLSYDLNGNMTSSPSQVPGFADRVMSYDAENRPLSVMHQGDTTTYIYGADGSRLLRVDPLGDIVATFGPVEIRDFGGAAEEVLTYPHPDLRLQNATTPTYLHRDQLGSVVALTDAAGTRDEARIYTPFGEITETIGGAVTPSETLGFIGERYDTDAGLQYLNARYYDPALGIFIQPDWFEVTAAGVGTNRYAYSFNDPINLRDPMGNDVCGGCTSPEHDEELFGVPTEEETERTAQIVGVVVDLAPVIGGIKGAFEAETTGGALAIVSLEALGPIGDGLRYLARAIRGVPSSSGGRIVAANNVPTGGFGPMRRAVDDPNLDGILNSNYGQVSINGARVGNGGTADALRYENATGELLSPSGHRQAAEQMRTRLQTYVRRATNSPNPNSAGTTFTQRDIDYANELIVDLNNALGN